MTSDNQTTSGITIRYANDFDSIYNSSVVAISVPVFSGTIASLLTAGKIHSNTHTFFNKSSNSSYTPTFYSGFNENDCQNAMFDLYFGMLNLNLENDFSTRGMQLYGFDASGAFVDAPDSGTPQLVYVGDTKIVAFKDNNFPVASEVYPFSIFLCPGQAKYDVVAKTCVSVGQCNSSGRMIQGALCVSACFGNYFSYSQSSVQYCAQQCPLWLGLSPASNGFFICVACGS